MGNIVDLDKIKDEIGTTQKIDYTVTDKINEFHFDSFVSDIEEIVDKETFYQLLDRYKDRELFLEELLLNKIILKGILDDDICRKFQDYIDFDIIISGIDDHYDISDFDEEDMEEFERYCIMGDAYDGSYDVSLLKRYRDGLEVIEFIKEFVKKLKSDPPKVKWDNETSSEHFL